MLNGVLVTSVLSRCECVFVMCLTLVLVDFGSVVLCDASELQCRLHQRSCTTVCNVARCVCFHRLSLRPPLRTYSRWDNNKLSHPKVFSSSEVSSMSIPTRRHEVQVVVSRTCFHTCLPPCSCGCSACSRLFSVLDLGASPLSFLFASAFAVAPFTPAVSACSMLRRNFRFTLTMALCLPSSFRVLSHETSEGSAFLVLVARAAPGGDLPLVSSYSSLSPCDFSYSMLLTCASTSIGAEAFM